MAKKYKLSEGFIKTFFGLFGKKDKPQQIQQVIDNDPRLKELDRQIAKLNNDAADRIRKNPAMLQLAKRSGIEI
jgi:hypothetical protein